MRTGGLVIPEPRDLLHWQSGKGSGAGNHGFRECKTDATRNLEREAEINPGPNQIVLHAAGDRYAGNIR
jgi:hypothetical protein